MTDLTPERRAELRTDAENSRLFRFVTGTASDGYPSSGYESIDDDITALLDAADERDRLAEQVEQVRAIHYPDHTGACPECSVDQPCATNSTLVGTDE